MTQIGIIYSSNPQRKTNHETKPTVKASNIISSRNGLDLRSIEKLGQ